MRNRILIGLILISGALFLYLFTKPTSVKTEEPKSSAQPSQAEKPTIVSTKPNPLDNIIIPADQIIEISFNRPLQNAPEFRIKFEPKIEFKVELSSDRKTAKIIPIKPYELGASYTLSIGPETKFDGVGNWGEDKNFRFRTVKYRGI